MANPRHIEVKTVQEIAAGPVEYIGYLEGRSESVDDYPCRSSVVVRFLHDEGERQVSSLVTLLT
jgi:hypothetical protein